MVDDVGSVLLPRDLEAFDREAETLVETVQALLDDGRAKVERVERLVCGLFGLDEALTDSVVEHAVARARRAMPDGE
jgi:hypothetical protein